MGTEPQRSRSLLLRSPTWPADVARRTSSEAPCGPEDAAEDGPGRALREEQWKEVGDLVGVLHHFKNLAQLLEEELSPEAVQELTGLQRSFWREPCQKCAAATSGAALGRAWGGPAGSWQVVGELPAATPLGRLVEPPFRRRELLLHSGARARGGGGLQRLSSCGVAAVTMKGKKGRSDLSLGQDNLSVSRLASGWQCICVADGHGPDGHWVATRAARTIPFFLMQAECDALLRDGRAEEALRRAFHRAEADLEQHGHEEQVRLYMSGCAATCVLRSPGARRAWAACAGDSRAALLAAGASPLQETRDHHPRVESELARCVEMGCELGVEEHEDGYVERRIFVKGKGYPGLLMTRSLGDLSVKGHGVVSTPEVVEWPTPQGALLIVASDGVWEVMSTQKASEIIFEALGNGKSRQQAVEVLASAARARWAEEDEDYCDDITVVLAPADEDWPALGSRSVACPCGAGLSRGPCTLQ